MVTLIGLMNPSILNPHMKVTTGVDPISVFTTVFLSVASCSLFGEHPRLAMRTFNAYYGTEDQRLDDCATCHTSGRSLNKYGVAVRAAITNVDASIEDEQVRLLNAALAAVEELDSDGDGFTNIVEINSGTFPGDESDLPFR